MSEIVRLNKPWMVAVWPGIGQVAVGAGYYLLSKLGVQLLAEFKPLDLFDAEHVEVKDGLIRRGRMPRSRLFLWRNAAGGHDIVIFLGEAQPTTGKHAFCRKLVELAKQMAVERVVTFAAVASEMRPDDPSRVFGAATDRASLAELKRLEVGILEEGAIGGLNGVLLGVAAENGLPGDCLLGEMPYIYSQLPYPKASLAVLETFATMAGLDIDMAELREHAHETDEKLNDLFSAVQRAMAGQEPGGDEPGADETFAPPEPEETAELPAPPEPRLAAADQRRIEQLFQQAQADRTKAAGLKRELDRLGLFKQYEDRFLDLFKKAE